MKTIDMRVWLIRYLQAQGIQCYLGDSVRVLLELYRTITAVKKAGKGGM